jgi:hypothetical protein
MGAQLRQTALIGSAGTAAPAARTVPQVVAERLFGVSCSDLLGGELSLDKPTAILCQFCTVCFPPATGARLP